MDGASVVSLTVHGMDLALGLADGRQGAKRKRRGGTAHVPTIEQLRFLARVRVASPRQFGLAFEHDVWWAYKRIERLRADGLADRVRPLRELPGVVRATPDGLAAAGHARSRKPRLSLDRLGHDLAVTELLLHLRKTSAATIRYERELWRESGSPAGGLIRLPGWSARNGRCAHHCPDLAVDIESRRWAVEVEFTLKGSARLRSILAAYRESSYAGVVYYVREPAIARALLRGADESGLGRRLDLRAWELWPDPSDAAAEIEGLAFEARARATPGLGHSHQTDGERAQQPTARSDERERERAAAITAWEKQLERRDADRAGGGRWLLRRSRGA